MKHNYSITFILVGVFLLSQFVGLYLTDRMIGEDLPYEIERPPVEEKISFVYILAGVFIGTILVLLLIKFRKPKLWKVWFFLSVVITLSIALSAVISSDIAFYVAIVLAIWKVYRPNVIVHNLTEIFIYSGIAIIFVPMMNAFSVMMLLVFISIYDAYAVWKSKHMVKLAEFQKQTDVFAGLSIPYGKGKKISKKEQSKKLKSGKYVLKKVERPVAVLGGGDMAFPLLFSGVFLSEYGLLGGYIISIFAALALLGLLLKSQKEKYYPAMPFISAGCFIGWFVVSLVL